MKLPLVSMLICTYNAEKFIKETLQSVLSQTYPNIEILILDNASSDNTRHIINSLIREYVNPLIRKIYLTKNLGPYEGLNKLLEIAKGAYVAINDHDDIWEKNKIAKQMRFLEEHPRYVGCGTGIANWYEEYDKKVIRQMPQESTVAWHTSLVFRNKGQRYDASIPLATDFYFMKNILCKNRKLIFNLKDVLVTRRIFKNKKNLSGNWMKKSSILSILRLDIPILDKLAILNRLIIPQSVIDWVWVHLG